MSALNREIIVVIIIIIIILIIIATTKVIIETICCIFSRGIETNRFFHHGSDRKGI